MNDYGFVGPGLWIRTIKHRFGARVNEWMLAIITTLWGGVLLLPGELFTRDAWSVFYAIFGSEVTLGWAMSLLGFLRIAGLIVNGARKRVTPIIRVASAISGSFIFMFISCSFLLSGNVSTWLAVYPVFAMFELINAYRASVDIGGSFANA